jgi:molybdenum cofactor biosynthesis protein B
MSHAHTGPSVNLRVHVVTVSTSRSPADDRSGDLIRALCEGAGHAVVGSTLVPDGAAPVAASLEAALGSAEVVLLTGGTGISARDVTAQVVRARLTRVLPGFGELFRMLSWQEIGAAAMLSDAVGGVARVGERDVLVFAMPGSTAACRLAMERLVLPELPHMARELAKEVAAPAEAAIPTPVASAPVVPVERDAEVVPARAGVSVAASAAAPASAPVGAPPTTGWRAAVASLGGTVQGGAPFALPEALERVPAARDVFASAGERAWIALPDGRRLVAFGFPDLARPNARVLAVAQDDADAVEVVALHRWPVRVGLCGHGPVLPRVGEVGPEAMRRTGAAPSSVEGELFAVETTAVHLLDGGRVMRWDGRRAGPPQPAGSALGSLLLAFSQR